MTFVFVRLNKGPSACWVRVDHVSELHELQEHAMPFDVIGTRLHLTTGRELAVKDAPSDVLEKMGLAMSKVCDGYFSSEDDE